MPNLMKQKPPSAPKQPPSKSAAPKPEAGSPKPEAQRVTVVVRRSFSIGGEPQKAGSVLAEVKLRPGVSLNILVDAVRNGFAAKKKFVG